MSSRREQYKSNHERFQEQERNAEEKEAKERAKRLQDSADLKELLDSKQARRYLLGLIERTKVFGESSSSNVNVYKENGRREVGLWILRDIKGSAPEYLNEFLGDSFND